MELLFDILKVLFGLIVGAVIGFFVCKKYMKKYLKDNQKAHQQFCVDCVERIAYEFPDVYALLKVHSWFAIYIAQKIYKGEDL